MVNYIDYIPNVLKEFEEFKKLGEATDPENNALWAAIDDLMKDQFVEDASENGVKRWESILKIVSKGSDSLSTRKFRIIARMNEKLPYTEETLHEKLTTLCGENGYTMVMNYGDYTLIVKLKLTEKQKQTEVESFLKRTIPANILIDLSLLYNQHLTLANYTHARLGLLTHEQLRSDDLSSIPYQRFEGLTIYKLEGVM